MNLKIDDRAKLQEACDEYKQTHLAESNNDYFEEKPYWQEKQSANNWAKGTSFIGHGLSVLIGVICGYHLGAAIFGGFDFEIYNGITIGSVFGVLLVAALAILWELIKNKFLHFFFKTWYQFKKAYTNISSWGKLAILFGGSMVLSGYGGYEVVTRWFGDAQTSQTTLVDVDSKTEHITLAISKKQARIDTLEKGQQWYVVRGKERRVKADNKIQDLEGEITTLNASLIAAVTKWENHNDTANGATDDSNGKLKAEHSSNQLWYALLFSLFAVLADSITLYCIRYNERYKYRSHLEMVGVSWFLEQQEKRNHKMQVVHRSQTNTTKTTQKPQETTQKPDQKKTNHEIHGECFWEGNKAFLWFKRDSDGAIVKKKASDLKGMRNKACGRAEKATTAEVKQNNLDKQEYYNNLYQSLIAFQNKAKAV